MTRKNVCDKIYKQRKEEVINLRFVHIADMHFDCPFTGLQSIGNLGDVRRLEQRKVFRKVIDFVKENNIEYLFISGDLYEHEYVRKSTIEYINNLFQEIPNTKIFIVPGNHDPYVKNSYYDTFQWSENVYICRSEFEVIREPEADIYMTGFMDFYMNESPIEQIRVIDTNKVNILLTHCDLNGARDENGFSYNPILETKINGLKFDYVAMGHIHKTNFEKDRRVVYPGSPISFGFDELGDHGMVVGEVSKNNLATEFIKLDEREFVKFEVPVDNIFSKEELVEKIANLRLETKNMYEIVLVGNRLLEINPREVLKLVDVQNILKIKDCTQIGYDIEKISKEKNLRGIFVREVIKKYEQGECTEEQIKKALEIGLSVL